MSDFRPHSRSAATLGRLTALALLLFLPFKSAAFSYDEAMAGDIDSPLESPPVFPFDLGSNVVSGSRLDGDSRDYDIFAFVIPEGSQLTSIRLDHEIAAVEGNWEFLITLFEVWTYSADAPAWYLGGGRLGGAGHPILSDGSDPMFEPEASPITIDLRASDAPVVFPRIGPSILPVPSGRYVFTNGSASRGSSSKLAGWDYTLAFSVVPVPEPGSALLVGVGLGVLANRRRRLLGES